MSSGVAPSGAVHHAKSRVPRCTWVLLGLAIFVAPPRAAASPSTGNAEGAASPSAASAEATSSEVAPAAPAAESLSRAARTPVRVAVRAGVLGEVGMLPAPSLGPRGALALARGPWSVELGIAALVPRRADLGGRGVEVADIGWWGGQALGCREVELPLAICVGLESGQLVGKGAGVDEPLAASGSWFAALAGASWRGAISEELRPLSWEVGAGAALALVRPQFGFDGLGVLHRTSSVSGRLQLGLGWH
jgi:hypothetical protein